MLGNLKIGQRVNLGLILIFILFIALSVFHIKSMNRLSEQTIKIYEYPLAVTNAVLRIHANITRMHHAMKDITRSYDLMSDGMIMRKYEEIEVYDHIVDTLEKKVFEDFEVIRKRFLGNKERYQATLDLFMQWKPIRDEVHDLMHEGDWMEATAITRGKGALHVARIEEAIHSLEESAQAKAIELRDIAEKTRVNSYWTVYLLLTITVLSGMIFAVFITKSITRPVELLRRVTERIGKGELDAYVDIHSKDEVGLLAGSFNRMIVDLKNVTASRDELDREISERKKAEQGRQKSEELFRLALKDSNITVFNQDMDLRYTWVYNPNPGLSVDEVIGKTDEELVPSDDAAVLTDMKQRALEQGKEQQKTIRFTVGDEPLYYDLKVEPMFDNDGRVIGVIGVSTDISDYRKAEETLRIQGEILENVAEGVMMSRTSDGVIVYTNPTFERLFGYGPDELLGRHVSVLNAMGEKRALDVFNDVVREMKVHGSWKGQVQNIKADGSMFWCQVHVSDFEHYKYGNVWVAVQGDITERKKAEEALRALKDDLELRVEQRTAELTEAFKRLKSSEEWLNEAQQVAQIGSWSLDLKTNHLEWSDENYRIFGIDQEKCSASYEEFLEIVHPDDREFVSKAYTDSVKNRTLYNIVHRLMMPDGSVKHVNERCQTFFNEDGTPLRSIGTTQDITEHKKADDALKASEERFRSFVVNSPAPMTIVDINSGEIEYLNRKNIEIFGYSHEDVPTIEKWQELVYPDKEYRKAVNKEFAAFINNSDNIGNESATYERSLRCKDGSYKEAEMRFTKFKDKLIVVLNDITEHKQAVNALNEITERLRRISDATFEGIVFTEEGRILDTNKQFASMFGYEQFELIGKDGIQLVAPEDRDLVRRNIVENHEETYEHLALRKDGSVINVEVRGRALQHQGRTIRVTVIRDITEQIKLQAETMRASQLASLGEMAAGVAHEINNPINGIISYAQLIELDEPEESRNRNICEMIIREGERIAEIVHSLLSFARENVGKKELCNVHDIIKDTMILVKAMCRKDGIYIVFDEYTNLPNIQADANELRQVLLNIVNNARQALNMKFDKPCEGKKLIITTNIVELDQDKYVSILITDYGVGIPKKVLEKVYNPFFTTKQAEGGSGLGLSISHSIIKAHGGTMEIDSKEGEYTKVQIMLLVNEG